MKYIKEETVGNILIALEKTKCSTNDLLNAIEMLANVLDTQTVDAVEVKHGHWELDGTCSVCGKHTLQTHGNFCCYCGADMREQRESK